MILKRVFTEKKHFRFGTFTFRACSVNESQESRSPHTTSPITEPDFWRWSLVETNNIIKDQHWKRRSDVRSDSGGSDTKPTVDPRAQIESRLFESAWLTLEGQDISARSFIVYRLCDLCVFVSIEHGRGKEATEAKETEKDRLALGEKSTVSTPSINAALAFFSVILSWYYLLILN